MNTKTIISISEARKRIFELAEEVQSPHKVYTLTADGKPKAVLMSAEEYESLIETLDIMQQCPDILDRFAESKRAFKTGDFSNFVAWEDVKKEWELSTVAEKSKKQYGVSRTNRKKSKKRTG